VQPADIPPSPQSATLGPHPIARNLLLISCPNPTKSRKLSSPEETDLTSDCNKWIVQLLLTSWQICSRNEVVRRLTDRVPSYWLILSTMQEWVKCRVMHSVTRHSLRYMPRAPVECTVGQNHTGNWTAACVLDPAHTAHRPMTRKLYRPSVDILCGYLPPFEP